MHIAFVTFGNITQHATLKRATGMALPLIARGHRVSILIEETADNLARVALECPSVELHFLQRRSAWQDLQQRRRIVNELQPDCVWVCGPGLRNWVGRVKGRKDACIIADHSELLSGILSRPKWRRFYDFVTECLFAVCFKEHVVASRYLERVYSKYLKHLGRQVQPLYFPYAFNREVHATEQPVLLEDLKRRYQGRRLIVYLGTFSENYGIFDMIHAVDQLRTQAPEVKLIMMGQGREKEAALEMLRKRGLEDYVEFPGYVPEEHLSSYFSAADVFICPLRDTVQDWARCPSKLFLFLPYQKPVVTCEIGEAAELFGKDGYYYTPRDVSSMRDVLARALKTGRHSALLPEPSEHDWEARVATFEAWLKQKGILR